MHMSDEAFNLCFIQLSVTAEVERDDAHSEQQSEVDETQQSDVEEIEDSEQSDIEDTQQSEIEAEIDSPTVCAARALT